MKLTLKSLLVLGFIAILNGCSDDETPVKDLKSQAIATYSKIVYASYDDSYITAEILKDKIEAFLDAPTHAGLEACKTAWLEARYYYNQTEAYRFYGGPVDGEDGVEGYLNAWPMDENFIDYTVSQPENGIINNTADYPTIDSDLLIELNESGSETNISTGYHAIEFLLWGQDLSDDGPGARPYTDYVVGENGTATNQERRGDYLLAAATLLVDQLETLRDEWKEGSSYRTFMEADENMDEAIDNIFRGMGVLSKAELAGERMLVAAESHDQENEHSCFSDNTLNDLKLDFQGIKNVFYGTYTRRDQTVVQGTSFEQVGKRSNKTKTDALDESFTEVETKLNAIPGPFDQAIVNNSEVIIDAAESLSLLSDRVADILVDIQKQ
jgi:putative iron-regulated protein